STMSSARRPGARGCVTTCAWPEAKSAEPEFFATEPPEATFPEVKFPEAKLKTQTSFGESAPLWWNMSLEPSREKADSAPPSVFVPFLMGRILLLRLAISQTTMSRLPSTFEIQVSSLPLGEKFPPLDSHLSVVSQSIRCVVSSIKPTF